eukprot:jgi/Ulvmu1/7185/UM034_0094.1
MRRAYVELVTGAGWCARCYSSRPTVTLDHPQYAIWSPNTGVGKTVISLGLAAAAESKQDCVNYVKPVQTGFPEDSDGRLVASNLSGGTGVDHFISNHAAQCMTGGEHAGARRDAPYQAGVHHPCQATTLFAWSNAVSPHLAAAHDGRAVSDDVVLRQLSSQIASFAAHPFSSSQAGVHTPTGGSKLTLIEMAGGICSPGPSGSLQVDLMRPLRPPSILIADGRLGGISATLSAYDSLVMRGYDIAAVVGMLPEPAAGTPALDNLDVIDRYLSRSTPGAAPPPVFALPHLVPGHPDDAQGQADLRAWLQAAQPRLLELHTHLRDWHERRVLRLREMPSRAREVFWWPFTQQKSMVDGDVTVIEARAGESFQVVQPAGAAGGAATGVSDDTLVATELYDGCASWWTQGVRGDAAPGVHRQMAYGAGRYGHVIFPEAVHEPALALSERLLDTVGRGWASKVFFSDDGSTAVEVALKMAFKKFAQDAGIPTAGAAWRGLQVLALDGGYHGDTLGVMDCSPESVFNSGQTPWYRPRGLFLAPPTLGLVRGSWQVRVPASLTDNEAGAPSVEWLEAADTDALFSDSRTGTPLAAAYRTAIDDALAAQAASGRGHLAACLMEPVMQGAGGMNFVDPLFQKLVAAACRSRGIPVIADEVFSGLWRLGHPSACGALGIEPDVACYAKLLTAGMVPLSVTLASAAVARAFEGDSKAEALLHGHSYTAHPAGCQVGLAAMDALGRATHNANVRADGTLRPLWPGGAVAGLSHHAAVERVVALGTVLAVELKVPEGERGYASGAARRVAQQLKRVGVYARPLGNVAYLMCTPTTAPEEAAELLQRLLTCLPDASAEAAAGSRGTAASG